MKLSARKRAFTLIEVILAIGIFAMVLVCIYSIWSGILRAAQAARNAADSAQRARIGIRTLEDGLLCAQMFMAHMRPQSTNDYYTFLANSEGEFADLEFTARLPATFPGVGRYDHLMRRVRFFVTNTNGNELHVIQKPLLMMGEVEPYSLVLAKDVQVFLIEFWGQQKETRQYEWSNVWDSTNALPKLVRVALGVGKAGKKGDAQDVVYRVIALPSTAIAPEWQLPVGAGAPQNLNRFPPGTGRQPPGGGFQPPPGGGFQPPPQGTRRFGQ